MHDFPITPHVGIGPILLGASRSAVRAALADIGFPFESSRGSLDYFANASIQVEFGSDERADFIGVACDRAYRLSYYGTDVFDTVADRVFALIATRDNSEHQFDPSGFVFPNQIITLWEADEQYDRLGNCKRPIWAQVGIGNHRYFESIQAIETRNG